MTPGEWEDLPWDMKLTYLDGMRHEGLFGSPNAVPSAPVQPHQRFRPDGRPLGTAASMTRRTVTAKVRFPDGL